MINVAQLLKDAPTDMKLYSPLLGEVKFKYINDSKFGIVVEDSEECYRSFDKYGRYFTIYNNAECLLFPSKDCRTWEGWKASKPHYDISNFKPKQWVLVRDDDEWEWALTRFSHLSNGSASLFVCINGASFQQCVPLDENEKLLGTTDPCDEKYINW